MRKVRNGWVLGSLFAIASLALSEDDRERELTPEEAKEIAALVERSRHLIRESKETRAQIERLLVLLSPSIKRHFPWPVKIDPPAVPTIKLAMPRGLAWLAASQRVDGRWRGVEATAFGTMVFVSDTFQEEALAAARLRVLLQRLAPRTSADYPTDLRRWALTTSALCRASACLELDRDEATLRRLTDLLLQRMRKGGEPSVARAWALFALREVTALDLKPPIKWSAVTTKTDSADSYELIAALLHRRAAEEADGDDGTLELARRLVSTRPRQPRSLEQWYLGAVALKDLPQWREWKDAMCAAVLRTQRRDGSWWEGTNDHTTRVRSTAVAVLCLRIASEP